MPIGMEALALSHSATINHNVHLRHKYWRCKSGRNSVAVVAQLLEIKAFHVICAGRLRVALKQSVLIES